MQLLRLCRAAPRSHLHNTLPSRPSPLPWHPPAVTGIASFEAGLSWLLRGGLMF